MTNIFVIIYSKVFFLGQNNLFMFFCCLLINFWEKNQFFNVFCFHYLHKVTLLRKGKEKQKKPCGVSWRVLFAGLKCAPSHFAFSWTFLERTQSSCETHRGSFGRHVGERRCVCVCVDCLNRHIYIQCICRRWFKAFTKGTIFFFCRCGCIIIIFLEVSSIQTDLV